MLESQKIFCIIKETIRVRKTPKGVYRTKTGEHTVKEKDTYKMHKKQFLIFAGILYLSACALFFFMGKRAVREPQETAAADFFAYTDRENRLYLWRERSGKPLLLTDHVLLQRQRRAV